MASAVIHVRLRDMQRTNLFIHELTTLAGDMRVMASPHAERLEHALERYVGGGDDEGTITDTIEAEETVEVMPCKVCGCDHGWEED